MVVVSLALPHFALAERERRRAALETITIRPDEDRTGHVAN